MKIKISGKPVKLRINGVLSELSSIKGTEKPIGPTPPAPSSLAWVQTTISSSSYEFDIVRYGANKFVSPVEFKRDENGLGYAGKLFYSLDGITWNETNLTPERSYYGLAYGDGKFITSGTGYNQINISSDGENWENTQYNYNGFHSIAYGDNKYVGIRWDKREAGYSTDGIIWENSTLPVSGRWTSVCFGNGKFVAICGDAQTQNSAYSLDGVEWVATSLPESQWWSEVAYGADKFVAVGQNCSAYSLDGINWIKTTIPPYDWSSVTFGDGKFVAISTTRYNKIAKSVYTTDGINWVEIAQPPQQKWSSVTYGNGKFVAVSSSNVSAYLAWGNGADSNSKIGTAKIGTAKVVSG